MKKKKNKKSGLSGTGVVGVVKDTAKSFLPTALEFGAATTGLALGSFGMKQVPAIASLPPVVSRNIPGIAAMLVATTLAVAVKNNSYVKSFAMGLGLSGFADVVNKNFGDKLPAQFALPQLSGMGYVQNAGGYPPEYFTRKLSGAGDSLDLGNMNPLALGEASSILAIG